MRGNSRRWPNQIAIAGLVQGLSEALHFAEKAGLDGREVVSVISKGAAGSWQMENRYETMLDDHFEHGFAVDWMRKDPSASGLSTANEERSSCLSRHSSTSFYKGTLQKMGGGRFGHLSLLQAPPRHGLTSFETCSASSAGKYPGGPRGNAPDHRSSGTAMFSNDGRVYFVPSRTPRRSVRPGPNTTP